MRGWWDWSWKGMFNKARKLSRKAVGDRGNFKPPSLTSAWHLILKPFSFPEPLCCLFPVPVPSFFLSLFFFCGGTNALKFFCQYSITKEGLSLVLLFCESWAAGMAGNNGGKLEMLLLGTRNDTRRAEHAGERSDPFSCSLECSKLLRFSDYYHDARGSLCPPDLTQLCWQQRSRGGGGSTKEKASNEITLNKTPCCFRGF